MAGVENPGADRYAPLRLARSEGSDIVLRFRSRPVALAFAALASLPLAALGDKHYDPGATDTAIKIGNIAPYTGNAEAYSLDARAEAAYFQMINDHGGINGRKIEFITEDSGGSSERTASLARKLIETDQVLLLFGVSGTAANLAIRTYMNDHKVPQLFSQSSLSGLDDPAAFPWTMGFFASYRTEGIAYAKYLLSAQPAGKIAVLHADDDAGREFADGLREGLGAAAAKMIVKEDSFLYRDPQIERRVGELKASGADVFANLTFGKLATQAIAAAYDADWHPLQFIPNGSLSIHSFLEPAGLKKAVGVMSNARSKGWMRPHGKADPEVTDFLAFLHQYLPETSLREANNVAGYERAEALVAVLKKCGDELTRANVMKQAANLNLELPMLEPGIRVTTSPTDYQPIKQLYLVRFDGEEWKSIGQIAGP
jgi:branched-chain amino acid transport system substrate-binding protein